MKKVFIFLLLVLISCNFVWSQCLPTVTISGNYISTYTGSNSWIASSGITTIPSGANVTLDGNPATNGYVLLSAGFETQPNATFLAVVQTPCNPLQAQIQSSQCGSVLTGLATTINASIVPGAQEYRFEITQIDKINNLPIAAPIIRDRPVNNLALSNVIGILLDAKYQIQIDVKLNNVWQNNFGPACYVSTPAPNSTIGTQCGSTVTSMSTFVYCTAAASVTGYRFRITNGSTSAVQIFDSSLNRFSFSQLPAVFRTFATSYFVEVALRNTDGTYLPFSIGCNISTPAFPTTRIRPLQCGNYQATSTIESFVAPIVATATKYRFRLSSVVPAFSATIDRLLNTFSLNMFPALPAGTACTVEVSLEIGGVFGPYGSACTIITPGLSKAVPVVSDEFVAIVFPNPFASDFMFNVKTSSESVIQIRIYDMLGKQIDNRNVEVSEIENLQIGANYPTGVYNVIVSQGENTQTLRVIKR